MEGSQDFFNPIEFDGLIGNWMKNVFTLHTWQADTLFKGPGRFRPRKKSLFWDRNWAALSWCLTREGDPSSLEGVFPSFLPSCTLLDLHRDRGSLASSKRSIDLHKTALHTTVYCSFFKNTLTVIHCSHQLIVFLSWKLLKKNGVLFPHR